jgi:hypothetical protein
MEHHSKDTENGTHTNMEQEHNFVPLQIQARLMNPIRLVSLCPTMDLVAIGLSGGGGGGDTTNPSNDSNWNPSNDPLASSVVIYRSIGWQKLMTIVNADLSSAQEELELDLFHPKKCKDSLDSEMNSEQSSTTNLIACIQWSPDGRQLVIGLSNGRVLLYNIDTVSSSTTENTTTRDINSSSFSNVMQSILFLPSATLLQKQYSNSSSNNNHHNKNDAYGNHSWQDDTDKGTKIMTRSMTLAQQKRIMRMTGKTPNSKPQRRNMEEMGKQEDCVVQHIGGSNIPVDIQWQRIRQPTSMTFQIQSIFLDKQQTFLPPCQYLDQWMQSNHPLPKATSPLTILAIRTTDGYIHYHAHGRYRIISIPTATCTTLSQTNTYCNNHMVLDSNFQTSILFTHHVHLIQIPLLTIQRYNLQLISHFYIHMTNHIQTITKGMKDVYNAWSSSVKQLDMKFDQMYTLFCKYAVIVKSTEDHNNATTTNEKQIPTNHMETIRMELMNYILGGHSSRLENTCNALDQFFTHPLMNDQLLLRMFKTCETNVMAVEQLLRKQIMGPIRSLLFDVGELNGIVNAMNKTDSLVSSSFLSSTNMSLMRMETCQRMVQGTKLLWTVAEQCLSQIVEARYRLDCMMKWIRSTASLVKAKGTAADSVQRQNARKRLVSEQVLRKVADFLSTPLKTDEVDDTSKEKIKYGSTECILGILWTDYFHKSSVYIEKSAQTSMFHSHRTPTNGNPSSDVFHAFVKSPSLKEVLKVTTDIYLELFEQPRAVLHRNIKTQKVTIQECIGQDDIISAIHTRFRSSNVKVAEIEVLDDDDVFACNTNWTIIANTCKSLSNDGCQQIQITAIPTGTHLTHESDDTSPDVLLYKSTMVSVPENCTVSSIQFYGDDGNSTLTSETSPSYKEGRQSLGILLRRRDGFLSNTFDEELWLFQYDHLHYTSQFAEGNETGDFQVDKVCYNSGRLVPESTLDHDDEEDDESIDYQNEDGGNSAIRCRCRKIRCDVSLEHGAYSQIVLSGSRGVGGVYSNSAKTIDLYDLEDDEENEDDDEEM